MCQLDTYPCSPSPSTPRSSARYPKAASTVQQVRGPPRRALWLHRYSTRHGRYRLGHRSAIAFETNSGTTPTALPPAARAVRHRGLTARYYWHSAPPRGHRRGHRSGHSPRSSRFAMILSAMVRSCVTSVAVRPESTASRAKASCSGSTRSTRSRPRRVRTAW